MAEIDNKENTAGAGEGDAGKGADKTFTQAELDRIVGDRLARERSKYADYEGLKKKAEEYDKIQESGKSELQKATERADKLQKELDSLKSSNAVREARIKVSKETQVPEELLTGEDEESCRKQAEAILKFAKRPKSIPGTKATGARQKESSETDDNFRDLARQIFKGE